MNDETENLEVTEQASTGEDLSESAEEGSGSQIVVQTIDTGTLELYTEQLRDVVDHSFMTTPIDEFTVTEGLLLCILVVMVLGKIGQAIKEGFYWLL